jgi:uncharacterized membrane protein
VYVLVFQHQNSLALYHLKQSIGLVLGLAMVTAGWIVIGWVLAWIPYLFVFSIALFALVLATYIYGIVAWLLGISNALRAQLMPLPLFGVWASRLPIR